MKRLLVVLFGVLGFQANAQSDSCFEEYTWSGGAGIATAKVLAPTSDDSSILNKGVAFLLQWKDREEILGGKVKVTLKRAKGDKIVPLGDPSLNNLPNTGYALISKRSLNGAKIKTGEENHYFQIEKVGADQAVIKSGCFTFHPKPARPNPACTTHQKMRDCVEALEGRVSDLQEQLTELKEGRAEDGQSGGATVINQDTTHEHPEYAAGSHIHNFASSSHDHDNAYATRDSFTNLSSELNELREGGVEGEYSRQIATIFSRLTALEESESSATTMLEGETDYQALLRREGAAIGKPWNLLSPNEKKKFQPCWRGDKENNGQWEVGRRKFDGRGRLDYEMIALARELAGGSFYMDDLRDNMMREACNSFYYHQYFNKCVYRVYRCDGVGCDDVSDYERENFDFSDCGTE